MEYVEISGKYSRPRPWYERMDRERLLASKPKRGHKKRHAVNEEKVQAKKRKAAEANERVRARDKKAATYKAAMRAYWMGESEEAPAAL